MHPRVVGLMYVMLLVGMIVSALLFGAALTDFSPGRLIQVIQAAAVATALLNSSRMEAGDATTAPRRGAACARPDVPRVVGELLRGRRHRAPARRVGVGGMAFGMVDILLEPFGGQVLHLPVAATTKLTALLALGGLLGFGLASRALGAAPIPIAWPGTGPLSACRPSPW